MPHDLDRVGLDDGLQVDRRTSEGGVEIWRLDMECSSGSRHVILNCAAPISGGQIKMHCRPTGPV